VVVSASGDNIPKNKRANKSGYGDLLTVLFSAAPPGSYLEIRYISQERRAPRQNFVSVKNLGNLHIHQRHGEHVYFGVLPRLERGNGRADGVALGICLWADLDGVPLDPDWWGLPAPIAVVRSSPGKFQLYRLLAEPIDLDLLEQYNARIAQLTGGDRVWDRARVLRLPGFVNWKYEDAPLAELLELHPDRTYQAGAFEAVLPELEEPIANRRSGGASRDKRGRLPEASPEDQELFRELWLRGYGIELRPGNGFYWCPFHESKSNRDDLHIDAGSCAWYCFGCGQGGGIRDLEALVEGKDWWGATEPPGASGTNQPGGEEGKTDARSHIGGMKVMTIGHQL
jgi:hypothetical protein